MISVRRVVHRLREFARAKGGNVALTFGLATLPVIGSVGAAIDYGHANSVKAAMQVALDSTALMISRDAPTMNKKDLQAKASDCFKALFTRPEAKNVTVTATYTPANGGQVAVAASANVPTYIMGIAGFDYISINTSAIAKWGSTRLRVALALDNTGSMADAGKMTALKSATKSLLAQLKDAASTNGDVYVSIVPFARMVNVGSSNYSKNWLDWTLWDSFIGKLVCGLLGNLVCHQTKWSGCVTDRGGNSGPSQDYDRSVTAPTTSIQASLFATFEDLACPVKMQELTYDWSALDSLVDSMTPNGMTNQPIGLVWAWQSLVGGGPLTAPAKSSNYNYKEIIILMSDGLNTANRWSMDQATIDKRMYDSGNGGAGTCANIKASGIEIYTIHVNTDGDPMSTLLKNCATSPDKFWMITSAADLGTVFNTIGTNITKLRVAQ